MTREICDEDANVFYQELKFSRDSVSMIVSFLGTIVSNLHSSVLLL